MCRIMQAFVRPLIELAIQDTLRHCDLAYLHQLSAIRQTLHNIMTTQTQHAADLVALTGTVQNVGAGVSEILRQLGDLKTAIGNTTPEVDAAMSDLTTTVTDVATLLTQPTVQPPANG